MFLFHLISKCHFHVQSFHHQCTLMVHLLTRPPIFMTFVEEQFSLGPLASTSPVTEFGEHRYADFTSLVSKGNHSKKDTLLPFVLQEVISL